MGRKKAVKEEGRKLLQLTDPIAILNLCKSITFLDLKSDCPMDMQYAKTWYNNHYLTGKHVRYVMKQGESIHHYKDGVVYRAHNITDAKAEQLMSENPGYKNLFIDLGPIEEEKEETTEEVEPITEPGLETDLEVEPEENSDSNLDQTPEPDTKPVTEEVIPDQEKEKTTEEVEPEPENKE
ncbi:hypothetical protein SAMN05444349_11879 [Bacteroides faecichinchillae]|uniref:Uncharacterized protein n=1 Tax=Bacteroides faecichinchillae TaxID=871325 RepID=A0A1M5BDU5_9BACE|nr:hypothetical protein [Bacteroides faecichinchillae]SHF40608.1 hypothetical protein SAMN05444349_11879 [Bacteroides faecichinchillae]